MTTPQQYRLMLPGGATMEPMAPDIVIELIKHGEVTQDYLFSIDGSDDWYPICKLPGIPAGALSSSSIAKTSFGQLLTCSLSATTIYTAISLLFSHNELSLTETSTWTALVIIVGVASLLLALVALGVFRHIKSTSHRKGGPAGSADQLLVPALSLSTLPGRLYQHRRGIIPGFHPRLTTLCPAVQSLADAAMFLQPPLRQETAIFIID